VVAEVGPGVGAVGSDGAVDSDSGVLGDRAGMSGLRGCPDPRTAFDLVLLDLDGVVYIGPDAVPGAVEALAMARAGGLRLTFVTNNASRPPRTVAEHLRRLGIPVEPRDVVTSAQAAATMLARRHPAGSAVLVVGGDGLYQALGEAGLRPVASVDDAPVAVVQGFAPDVGWRQLAEGARGVRAGLPWLATNTDLTVPTPHGPAPGNGALVAAISLATGAHPDVAGKPRPPLFTEAAARFASRAPLVVGDRLDTDLEGARAAGMTGMLVLTGVHRAADVITAAAPLRPHLLALDLRGLGEAHPEPVREEGPAIRWSCHGARVRASTCEGLMVEDSGADGLDLLRAACAAAWETLDTTGRAPDPAPAVAALTALDPAGPWTHRP
jgi:glycerol 3-phosphatase-2